MTLAERWAAAEPFPSWCARTVKYHDLWTSLRARAAVAPGLQDRARALAHRWRLLVLTEDWCGDAVNTLPTLARLADLVPERLELRCLARDRNLDLMDEHLTSGARSIPKVLGIDAHWTVRATWGPRPAELQAWVYGEGRRLVKEERYKHVRGWYARDRGTSTVGELLTALETAAPAA
ncbi:MAG: thioredoxin family protein [Gemmatimonadetes bacterium]|nr:thioredoxin family protein [Gemmatimonadota bacterium]